LTAPADTARRRALSRIPASSTRSASGRIRLFSAETLTAAETPFRNPRPAGEPVCLPQAPKEREANVSAIGRLWIVVGLLVAGCLVLAGGAFAQAPAVEAAAGVQLGG